MKAIIVIIATVTLAACVTPPLKKFADTNLPLVQQGTMKWSEYYTLLFNEAVRTNAPAQALERTSLMIQGAQRYEAGKMSQEDFEAMQRIDLTGQIAENQADAKRTGAAVAAAIQSMGNAYKPPPTIQTNCTTVGNQTKCVSR